METYVGLCRENWVKSLPKWINEVKQILIKIFISLAIVGYLLSKINFDKIIGIRLHWSWLPLMFVTMLCAYYLRSMFYRETINILWLRTSAFFLITGVYNLIASILPVGIGHLSYPYFLKKYYQVVLNKGLASLLEYNLCRAAIFLVLFIVSVWKLHLIGFIGLAYSRLYFLCVAIFVFIFTSVFYHTQPVSKASDN